MNVCFKTLANTSEQKILELFNLAFSDYSIPFQLTIDQLQSKFKSEQINLDYSILAHDNDRLMGFIFHGSSNSQNGFQLYNGGTGVIPCARGNGLTVKMYEWFLEQAKARQINTITLEVISDNAPAITSYRKVGFTNVRKLNCYKGLLNDNAKSNSSLESQITQIDVVDWELAKSFWDCEPSYQNGIQAIETQLELHNIFGAYSDDQMIGYLIINPANARIKQLAVDPKFRGNKIGNALLQRAIQNFNKPLSIINVDESSNATNVFFMEQGLMPFLIQNEMLLQL